MKGFEAAIDMLDASGHIKHFTKVVAEGIGFAQMRDGMASTIDRILKRELVASEVNSRLPKGFRYVGYRVWSPLEQSYWQQEKNKKASPRNRGKAKGIDVARSDYYMIELEFELPPGPNGVSVRRKCPLFVPYARRGSIMAVRGTDYHLSNVYHTPGICLMDDGLFVNFNFTRKVSFKDNPKSTEMIVQGRKKNKTTDHFRTDVYRLPSAVDLYKGNLPQGGRAYKSCCPIHTWLFAQYGFTQAVRRYTGVDVAIMTKEQAEKVSTEHYVILRSGNNKLRDLVKFVLVVPREALPFVSDGTSRTVEETDLLSICATFFELSHFFAANNTANVNYLTVSSSLNYEEDIQELYDPDVWKIILGKAVLGVNGDSAEILKRIRQHLNEITRYMCPRFRGELQSCDESVPDDMDIFDFLFYTSQRLNARRNRKTNDIASLYGKRLTVVDYLLLGKDGFTSSVSHLRWKLESLVKDLSDEEAAKLDLTGRITGALNTYMKVGLLQGLESTHGEVSTFNCATESLVLGVSTHAIDQTETSKRSNRSSVNLDDQKYRVNSSTIECGSIFALTKSSTFGWGIGNQYVKLSSRLETERNPLFIGLLDDTQSDLSKIGS